MHPGELSEGRHLFDVVCVIKRTRLPELVQSGGPGQLQPTLQVWYNYEADLVAVSPAVATKIIPVCLFRHIQF